VCLDCHRKAGLISKQKRDVINVMPEYGFYNAKTREKVERDKHSVM
jgi:predicted NUDIX family phosphoesterase